MSIGSNFDKNRLDVKLTDAIGVLNGLFEAQKLLQGSKPSFASSGLLHRSAIFLAENTIAYLDLLWLAKS